MKTSAIKKLIMKAGEDWDAPGDMALFSAATNELAALEANEARIRQEVIEECVQTCLKLHNSMLEAGNVICSNGVTHCITALHALKEAPCQSEK